MYSKQHIAMHIVLPSKIKISHFTIPFNKNRYNMHENIYTCDMCIIYISINNTLIIA